MVWTGAKMIDGYCHDCYVRGRHLPEDDDSDQWLAGSGQKKKSPKSTPAFKPPVRLNIRRIIYAALIIASVIFAINVLRGIGGGRQLFGNASPAEKNSE